MRNVIAAAAVAMVAAFVAALAWKPPATSADVASWAQAITTGVAVVVALFMPMWQHERERCHPAPMSPRRPERPAWVALQHRRLQSAETQVPWQRRRAQMARSS